MGESRSYMKNSFDFTKFYGSPSTNYLVYVKDIVEAEKKLRIKQLVSNLPHKFIVPKQRLKLKKNDNVTEFENF